jgi:hypothetical protein
MSLLEIAYQFFVGINPNVFHAFLFLQIGDNLSASTANIQNRSPNKFAHRIHSLPSQVEKKKASDMRAPSDLFQ